MQVKVEPVRGVLLSRLLGTHVPTLRCTGPVLERETLLRLYIC
jgi:hypothetical protein